MRWLKLGSLFLVGLLIFLAVSFVYLLGPKDRQSGDKQEFIIQAGENRAVVADHLAEQGLVRSSFAFFLFSKIIRSPILPGTYEFSPAQSASIIAESIAGGKIKTTKITLIEGWRVSQIAEYLAKQKELKDLKDFMEKAAAEEGYLFPDTYDVKVDITSDELIKLLKDNFKERTKGLEVTKEDIVLASIVEREAANDSDRPQIAQVFLNRQKIGMKLESDPTVQYAKGDWKIIGHDDLAINSPYNTYQNAGLPPGPICNPGLASIKAVLVPTPSDYLFFFHAKGETYFSKTYAEHSAKVRQYF